MYIFVPLRARPSFNRGVTILIVPSLEELHQEIFLTEDFRQLSCPLIPSQEGCPQKFLDSKDLEIANLLRSLEDSAQAYVQKEEYFFLEKTETFFAALLPECTCVGVVPKPLEVIRGPPALSFTGSVFLYVTLYFLHTVV